jgi:hypothetical protein
MGYSVRNGKLGFECDVCESFFPGLFLMELCHKCKKQICPKCQRIHLSPSRSSFRLQRYPRLEKPTFVCPDCEADLESEEIEAQAEKEEESPKLITKCALCTATDKPPEYKTFGYRPPTFTNCEKCGKLVCDQCLIAVYDPSYDYDLVCRDCYQSKEQQDEKEREEYWREKEEEENKFEE